MYTTTRFKSTNGGQKAFGVNLVVSVSAAQGWHIVAHKAAVPDPATAIQHSDIPGPRREPDSLTLSYFDGGGVKISRLPEGSGFGLGFGAFFASFLPLSLLPMRDSMTQKGLFGQRPLVMKIMKNPRVSCARRWMHHCPPTGGAAPCTRLSC